ncbi:MAG TPA: hypothetical protein DCS87_12065 [Rheinheimera sp.]|nr:hypothetical protein [Rheinheimera sp.]
MLRKFIATVALLISGYSHAGLMTDCDAVQLTSVTTNSGFAVPIPAGLPLNAAQCYQIIEGNDTTSSIHPVSSTNLGWKNDGYLNTAYDGLWGETGAFTTAAELQDLKTPGVFVDPGWIYMGKSTDNTFVGGTSSNGTVSYTYVNTLFTLKNCYDADGVLDADCNGSGLVKGEWQLKPPANNPAALLQLLGSNRFFDAIALVFKSGNNHAIYNFSVNQLGLPSGIGTNYENLVFGGIWDMSNVLRAGGQNGLKNPAGLSHISVWGRDPSGDEPPPQVSAPASLGLLGLSLLLLVRRRRA